MEQDFIDNQLSVNLDSTDAFEGPEKLLELWFAPNEFTLPFSIWNNKSLFDIPYIEIENLLNNVNCQILSHKRNNFIHAYLLSESSLFIFKHKLILKTCGTTTTLLSLEKLLNILKTFINNKLTELPIFTVFYSHRSFMFPEKQLLMHQSWDDELNHLNKFFKIENSKDFIFGNDIKNKWHFYVNKGNDKLFPQINSTNDITIEILMTGLKNVNIFYRNEKGIDGHINGIKMMEISKFNKILPLDNMIHDAFAFMPCGYSSNSIKDDIYTTIHITPESEFSYASFETNYPINDEETLNNIINNVINALKPEQYTVTVCYEGIKREYLSNKLHNHNQTDIDASHGYRVLCAEFL